MGRLKTFGKYILMIVAFYVFSTIVSAGFIRGTYADMGGKVYQGGNLSVYVDEAKSSFVNGHIKGNITNNSNENITSKYVKIELNTSITPALVKPIEGNLYEYLILPVRISSN